MPEPLYELLPEFRFSGRNRVITAAAERIASENSPDRQQRAFHGAMHPQSLKSVLRTGRNESAARRNQGRKTSPIDPDQKHQAFCSRRNPVQLFSNIPAFFKVFTNAPLTSCIFTLSIPRRGIKMIPHGEISPAVNRKASHRRRLARFRFTARLSNFLLHMMPHFSEVPKTPPATSIIKYCAVMRLPPCFTESNSLFSLILQSGSSRKAGLSGKFSVEGVSILADGISVRERVSSGLSHDDGQAQRVRRELPFWL